MIPEHELIVLTCDMPDDGLKAGDLGTVVQVHRDGVAYEVEFTDERGDTIAVTTVEADQLRRATERDWRRT